MNRRGSTNVLAIFSAVLAGLCFMVGSAGCGGFFVKPSLTSITISPAAPSLQASGQTVQLTATGNFNDGSTQVLTSTCTWSSSAPVIASVSSSGLVTAKTSSPASATITASCSSNGSAAGTVTVTIGPAAQVLSLTSSLGTSISLTTVPAGTAISFTASLNGGDVTSQTTFTSSDLGIITLGSPDTSLGSIVGGQGTVTISGTGAGATGSVTITVGP